jgi:hypothetical protein
MSLATLALVPFCMNLARATMISEFLLSLRNAVFFCRKNGVIKKDASHRYGQINMLIQIQNTSEIMIDFILFFYYAPELEGAMNI